MHLRRHAAIPLAMLLWCCVRDPGDYSPLGLPVRKGATDTLRIGLIRELGQTLFFDRSLSLDSSISCASCHDPRHAFTEPHARSRGIGVHARRRNAPSLLNVAFLRTLDWDGRASTLEDQVLGVFTVDGDMGIDVGTAFERVEADPKYAKLFIDAFGRGADTQALVFALATFQRSLLSGTSKFDRYYFGGDTTALADHEKLGLELFIGKGRCEGCHTALATHSEGSGGALFTDMSFHNLGVGYAHGRMNDVGRFAVTRRRSDWGAFRTPSLRNVAMTAPYMHDGSLRTLREVVAFYNRGGNANPNLDRTVGQLGLDLTEQQALVAFLEALTSEALLDTAAVARRWGLRSRP